MIFYPPEILNTALRTMFSHIFAAGVKSSFSLINENSNTQNEITYFFPFLAFLKSKRKKGKKRIASAYSSNKIKNIENEHLIMA